MSRLLVLPLLSAVMLLLSGCGIFSPDEEPGGRTAAQPSTTASATPTQDAATPVSREFFGVHDHEPLGDQPGGWPDAPVGSLRAWDAFVTWKEIELSPGAYSFDRLDALVDTAEAKDADVLLVLGQTPVFHATDPAAASFYGEGASSPPKLAAWRSYVRAVAERYVDRPVVLQVWNEPNVAGFWSGTPQEMAELTKVTHEVLAEVDPEARLVAPGLVTRLSGQRAWIDQYYGSVVDGQPVADFVDVVALQLYPAADGTPESSMELLAAMRTVLDTYGVEKPIWNTEINYGLTGTEVEPAPRKQQIANVAQTVLLNAANDVERIYWYGWDQQLIVDTLLTEPDGATRTPAGEAFVTMQDWLVGARVGECSQDAEGTYACAVPGPDGDRTAYWNPDGETTVVPPAGSETFHRVGARERPLDDGESIRVDALPVLVTHSG